MPSLYLKQWLLVVNRYSWGHISIQLQSNYNNFHQKMVWRCGPQNVLNNRDWKWVSTAKFPHKSPVMPSVHPSIVASVSNLLSKQSSYRWRFGRRATYCDAFYLCKLTKALRPRVLFVGVCRERSGRCPIAVTKHLKRKNFHYSLRAKFCRGNINIHLHLCHYSTSIWHMYFKSFLK